MLSRPPSSAPFAPKDFFQRRSRFFPLPAHAPPPPFAGHYGGGALTFFLLARSVSLHRPSAHSTLIAFFLAFFFPAYRFFSSPAEFFCDTRRPFGRSLSGHDSPLRRPVPPSRDRTPPLPARPSVGSRVFFFPDFLASQRAFFPTGAGRSCTRVPS